MTIRSDGSFAKSWKGARHASAVRTGERCELTARVCAGSVVRLGWAAEGAGEVGTDWLSWGYGSTARRSHDNDYHPYGLPFYPGDNITCILDRRGHSAAMHSRKNDVDVSEDPAYQIPWEGPLLFAVCGAPGFSIQLTCEEAIELQGLGEELPEDPKAGPAQDRTDCPVMVCTFSRHPANLDAALMGSDLACPALERGLNVRPGWANGAKIFADVTASDVEECRVEQLCPRHVVIYKHEIKLLEGALLTLPYRQRPRLKGLCSGALACEIPRADVTSVFQASSQESDSKSVESVKLAVKNTFLCTARKSEACQASARSV